MSRYRLISDNWQQIDLLGKPVRISHDLEGTRPRRWLITTVQSGGGQVLPFQGTEAAAHERARSLGSDRYCVTPRDGV